jgi:hypothetical protein
MKEATMANANRLPPEIEEVLYLAGRANVSADRGILGAINMALRTGDRQLLAEVREDLLFRAGRANIAPTPFAAPGPLPPGAIPIGRAIGAGPGTWCWLSEFDLTRHVGCFAPSGGGKSFWVKHMAIQFVRRGIPFWLIDQAREHGRHLASLLGPDNVLVMDIADFRRNPFEVLPVERPIDAITRIRRLHWDLHLMDGSINLLDQVLKELYEERAGDDYPTFSDYHRKLTTLSFRAGSRYAGYLESLLNRATGILNHLGPIYDCVQGFDLTQLMRISMVLEMRGLDSDAARFFVDDLLSAVAALRSAARE